MQTLPTWRCHKLVKAACIIGIGPLDPQTKQGTLFLGGPGVILDVPADWKMGDPRPNAQVEVSLAWMDKHEPQVGGYFVVYEDGYQSYSPADAFLAGYDLIGTEVTPAPSAPSPKPKRFASVGRIVGYTLTEQDADQINRRRTNFESIAECLKVTVIGSSPKPTDGGIEIGDATIKRWPVGAQAHIGNPVSAGEVFPAIMVGVWGQFCANLQVLLDGTDSLWVTSRHESTADFGHGPDPGKYHWLN